MELPVWLTLALVNLVLVSAGFILFLPEGFRLPPGRETVRLFRKYRAYVIAALAVLGIHLLLVQADPLVTDWLGWNYADDVAALEGDLVPSISAWWTPLLSVYFSTALLVVHPFMLYFAPLLYMLTDEERAARGSLLLYPLAYALVAPFYLFLPVTSVYVYFDLPSPFFEQWPALSEVWFRLTTANNAFPSLSVALALLLANAARYSRNRNFRYFTFVYAASVVVAPLYLGLHWATDVAGGILVAASVATLTNRILSVERLALQRIKPEPEEAQAIRDTGEELVGLTGRKARELHVPAEPMLVGSVAKDTYLAHKVDFDVFALFPPDLPREELQAQGLRLGRAVVPNGIEKYAEHPYIHGTYRDWEVDLVPAYKVSDPSQKMSAVDRTPFHTRYVLENMTREERDQTRLLKQFMYGVGTYGAEARTQGFSGYLCELLILKYHTFRRAVRAAAAWKPGTFLCLHELEGNPKFTDPLVFLDPVDPDRNAASAVSAESLARYAEACRAYLQREGLSFFFPRQIVPLAPEDLERIVRRRRRRGDFVLVETSRPQDVLEDHLYAQMRKAEGAIRGLLERHEFEVRRITWAITQTHIQVVVELVRMRLPEAVTHTGPPLKEKDHAERFRKTWTDNPEALGPVYEENGRVKVKRKRRYRRADELLRDKLPSLHLGKHVSQAVRDGFELATGADIVRDDTTALLTDHFTPKQPWEL